MKFNSICIRFTADGIEVFEPLKMKALSITMLTTQ